MAALASGSPFSTVAYPRDVDLRGDDPESDTDELRYRTVEVNGNHRRNHAAYKKPGAINNANTTIAE